MKLIKLLFLVLVLTLNSTFSLFSQAYSYGNGSLGIVNILSSNQNVNSYYSVNSIAGNFITFNSSAPIINNTRVLIIQMEGALAGTWEWGRIDVSNGTTAQLVAAITKTYNFSDRVQLITVPEYEYLNINPGASLTCLPYNPTTGTGGVLAFNVKETFTIYQGGSCNVTGKGYPGGTNGIGGVGGLGGNGGLAGIVGQNGGSVGVQANTGLFGGGNGGSYGTSGTSGTIAGALVGVGSGVSPTNNSQVASSPTRLILGGAGAGGNGGDGKAGAGGGGGGAGLTGSQNGTSGAAGTAGGNGGNGGNGGGIILFSAKNLVNSNSSPSFIANGTNGTSATNGTVAGNGGNGGIGVNCSNAGGGGGGRGGDGGNGGNGGSGGAGGTVYAVLAPTSNQLTASAISFSGGSGAQGGQGGAQGFGGQNAGSLTGACTTVAASPFGSCSLEETLSILVQMGISGTNNAVYSLTNNVHRWQTPSGAYYVQLSEVYPGQNAGQWLIVGVGASGPFFAYVTGDPSYNLYQALDYLVTTTGVVTYTSTANTQIGEIVNGNEMFTSVCGSIRNEPEDGTPGDNGSAGPNGNQGQFGSESPSCDPANLNYEVNTSNGNNIIIDLFGNNFIGDIIIDGDVQSVSSNTQIVLPIYGNELYVVIYGQVYDECGNSIELSWTIDFPPPPPCTVNFNYSIQNATCANPQAVVTVDVTINPGTYGLNYYWSDNGFNDSQSGDFYSNLQVVRTLSPGNYDFQVTDFFNSCFGSLSITIDEPEVIELSLNTTISQPSCLVPYGTIQANTSMGTAPYTYILNGGVTSTTGTFSGLNPGSYTIEVIDANGCSTVSSNPITINSIGSNLILNHTNSQPTCTNPFGTITALITGGTAPYTYSLNGQTPTNNPVFSNLTAGVYTITCYDVTGCSTTSGPITINNFNGNLSLSATGIPASCTSGFGTINATVTGGTAPYAYTINGQANPSSNFINLASGNYVIGVSDANGCSTSQAVMLSAAAAFSASATITQPNCPGEQGSISVAVNGGTAPYLYDFGQGQISNSSIIATPGTTYNVTVSDANNCTASVSNLTINALPNWNVQVTTTSDFCGNSNGTINVNVIYPTGTSTILWMDGNQSFYRDNLPTGNYGAWITDATGCTYFVEAMVESEKYDLQTVVTADEINCNKGSDGSIEVTVLNGVSPYLIDWGFATGSPLTNLSAATYTATVTDANGCNTQVQYTLVSPAPLSLNATIINANCNAACDGSITLSNPTTFNLSSLNWSPSNDPTSLIQTNLCAGTYQVTAISDLGCEITQSYTITEPDKIIINLAAATNNPCYSDKVGSIKVIVTGGVAPYTYAWSNGGTTDYINNLASGTYTLVVTDANGCNQSFQYTVTSPPQLFLNISGNTSYCAGSSATITVSGSGGVAPYFGTGTFTYLAGTYQLSIKDKNGCKAVKDITIIELPLPKFNIASTNSCKEQTVGTATLTPIIATQPVTYLWSNSQTTQSITNLAPGVYSVTVTDANGCTNSYTTTVFTNATPTLSAAITNAGCAPATNGSIVLTVNQIANNPNVTYLWNTSATTSQLSAVGAGNYSVVVTDNSGCTVTGNYPITNDCGCPLNFSVDICGPTVVCQGESFTLTSNVFPRPQGYPYTYSWTTPLGTVITIPNLSITGAALTASGWYTLTVSLPPNCTYTTQVYVTVRPRPIATISNAVTGTVDNYIHMRTCDIQLTATGGVYYNWTVTSPPILTNHSNQLTLPTTLTSPTLINFRVVAIDSFGCASQQVLHRVRTANPVVSRSINNTSTNPNIIRTLTMNQTTQFANATYTWSTNGWSSGPLTVALKQRTGTIAQLAGIYTLVINQNGCERTFQFELLNNATFTPTIEIGPNKMHINEEVETQNSVDAFELTAFPNPVSDILTVSFKNPDMDDIGLTITDINGRILMDKNVGNEELITLIDVSSFATGMYFVQCTRNSVVYPEKLKIIKK